MNNTNGIDLRVFAACWECGKLHSTKSWPVEHNGIKCSCGGYVVTPSGKVQIKVGHNV